MWPWCDLVAFHQCSWLSAAFSSVKIVVSLCMQVTRRRWCTFLYQESLEWLKLTLKHQGISLLRDSHLATQKASPLGYLVICSPNFYEVAFPCVCFVKICLTFFLLYIVTILGDDAYPVKVLSSLVEDTLSSPSWNGYNWQWVQKGCCCSVLGCISTFEIMFTAEESSVIYWGVAGNLQERLCFDQINKFIHLALSVFECLCWLVQYTAHFVTFIFFCSQPAVIITIIRTIIALSPSYKLFTADAQ